MRLYRLPKMDGIDDLTPREAERPAPGRGQVLVRMRAASLNYRDLIIATGRYGALRAGLVPVSDGAGEVVDVGADVARVKPGDRVCPIFMQTWLGGAHESEHGDSALGGSIDGVLAEYCLFEQDGLVPLPAHLSFEEGASLPCAAVTAWNALYAGQNPLKSGDIVLTLGTGGVSIFALQFARAAGARVIVTSSSDAKLARARELGAGDGVNYRDHPEWDAEVLRLTEGRGADHVIEVGGPGTLQRSIGSVRLGGAVNLIGAALTEGQIDPMPLMRRCATLRGIRVGSRQMFEAMNRTIEMHGLRPVIDKVFDFEQAAEAYRYLQSQAHLGKVVIRIGEGG